MMIGYQQIRKYKLVKRFSSFKCLQVEIHTYAQCLFRKCNQERDRSCLGCHRLYSSRWSALAFLCRGTLLSSKYINYEIALEYIFEFKIALEQIYK